MKKTIGLIIGEVICDVGCRKYRAYMQALHESFCGGLAQCLQEQGERR